MKLTASPEQPNLIIQNGNGNEYISIFNDGDMNWYIGTSLNDATCIPSISGQVINKADWGYWEQEVEITISFDESLIDEYEQRYARVSEFVGTRPPVRRP